MIAENLTIARLWREFMAVIARNGPILLAGIGGMLLVDVALTAVGNERLTSSIGNIVSLIVTYFVLLTILRREGLVEDEGGFGSYFGASFLSGLAVIVGLILLIVPGLFLLARWSIGPALALTRRRSMIEALRESWALTQSKGWTLVGAYALAIVVAGSVIFGTGFAAGMMFGTSNANAVDLIVAVPTDITVVLGAAFTTAIYRLVAGGTETVRAVFG